MRKSILIVIVASLALAGFVYCAGEIYDASNFSADGRKWQPAPSGHTAGKDNGPGEGLHHMGEDCGICHRKDGKAGNYVWTMSGTLYQDRAGRTPLVGGEIILQDCKGNVISMTTNEQGNFWTTTRIASNPYAIASHGGVTELLYSTDAQGVFHPADPDDARTWQYKAWVKSGDYVRYMVTIAPVGGSTDPDSRMSCSMHHAGMGSRGALWGNGKSTLPSYPSTQLSYKKHILPIFASKCVPCHIPGATVSRLVTKSDVDPTPTTVDFGAGLDLTTFEGSTAGGISKAGVQSVVNTAAPASSPLLGKTLFGSTHGGGSFWTTQDADYKALLQWIAEGAQKN